MIADHVAQRMGAGESEYLKQRYEEQLNGIFSYASTVRKIICFVRKGVYTTIKIKKYCSYNTCGSGNNKLQKYKRYFNRKDMVCPVCNTTFTPKRSDAKYCSNAAESVSGQRYGQYAE